jgi:hypothetical protein
MLDYANIYKSCENEAYTRFVNGLIKSTKLTIYGYVTKIATYNGQVFYIHH